MLGLKLQYLASWCEEPTHHKGPWCWKDWRQEARGRQDEMVGWHHWLDGHEFEQAPEDGAGQGGLVCCSHRGHKESDTTEQLTSNNTFKQTLETITTVRCRGVFPTVALDSSQRWQHPGERMLNQVPELNAGEWTVFDSGNTGRKHLSRRTEKTLYSPYWWGCGGNVNIPLNGSVRWGVRQKQAFQIWCSSCKNQGPWVLSGDGPAALLPEASHLPERCTSSVIKSGTHSNAAVRTWSPPDNPQPT